MGDIRAELGVEMWSIQEASILLCPEGPCNLGQAFTSSVSDAIWGVVMSSSGHGWRTGSVRVNLTLSSAPVVEEF